MNKNRSGNHSLAQDIRIKYNGDGGAAMASICALLHATPAEAEAILVKCVLQQKKKHQRNGG